MRRISIITCLAIVTFASAFALEPQAIIISQEGAPLKIESYSAKYREGSNYSREGIRHEVKYTNVSSKTIVALRIGLVSFDVWNEFLDKMGGVAIEDLKLGDSKPGVWIASAYADFSFLTGVAYVNKVRFEDGTFWEADLDVVIQELQKIQKDFDVASLKKKEGEE